ncbi:MAG TPA: DUF4252 domain-containing protein [Flavobacteriales bacterium]|nr:DUF4252 domain-containing protein [Flavobacteriales bacterium]|tara:strand:+ start:9937 stop:10440 length:504 start_codon:yes stop_codon:yes gene_type:complete
MIKRILSVAMFVSIAFTSFSQSNTVTEFEKKNEGSGYNLYMYQSVIRVLNKDDNQDFNRLIRDLDFLKVIITDSTESSAKTEYLTLSSSIIKEGYEELFMIDNKDMKASIYEKEGNSDKSEFVAFVYSADFHRTGAFQMKGELDLKYLKAFESLDFQKLKELAEDQN